MKKNICVFCGSRKGLNLEWEQRAQDLGQAIALRKDTLIFGGGGGGLMGVIAKAAIIKGGDVIGIIPKTLVKKEPVLEQLSKVHYVESMSERKDLMKEMSDVFIIIPGGVGTLDELFDVWATKQTGYHHKQIIIANWSDYYHDLIKFFDHSILSGLMTKEHLDSINFASSIEDIFHAIDTY